MSSETVQRSNLSGRLTGQYQAQVVSVEHPDGLYLASVRLLGLWDSIQDADLPWAEFLLPLGAKPSNGHAVPVEAYDYVWVDFPRNGDTRFPRITGSLYHAPDYVSYLPEEVNGEAYKPKRHDSEPEPPAYTRKDDLRERFGLREHRTSEGGYSVTHTGTGTAIEITPSGQIVIHAEGDSYQSATGNHKQQIDGKLEIIVKGACSVTAKDKVDVVATSDVTVTTDAGATVDAGSDITLKAGGSVNIEAGGDFAVKAASAPFTLG